MQHFYHVYYYYCNCHFSFVAGDEPEDADFDAPKVYEIIGTFENLNDRLKSFMVSYNETVRGGSLDLVFFKVNSRIIRLRLHILP